MSISTSLNHLCIQCNAWSSLLNLAAVPERVADCLPLMVAEEKVDCSISNQSHTQLGTPPHPPTSKTQRKRLFGSEALWNHSAPFSDQSPPFAIDVLTYVLASSWIISVPWWCLPSASRISETTNVSGQGWLTSESRDQVQSLFLWYQTICMGHLWVKYWISYNFSGGKVPSIYYVIMITDHGSRIGGEGSPWMITDYIGILNLSHHVSIQILYLFSAFFILCWILE